MHVYYRYGGVRYGTVLRYVYHYLVVYVYFFYPYVLYLPFRHLYNYLVGSYITYVYLTYAYSHSVFSYVFSLAYEGVCAASEKFSPEVAHPALSSTDLGGSV